MGDFCGQLQVLFKVALSSKEGEYPFIITRYQFPVRLCFSMTINRSQGQSFKTVGVDLRSPCFSHGQFYVAMSRTSKVDGLHVLTGEEGSALATNVVYLEVLTTI